MKVAIVNCFDTFLERQTALLRFFQSRGDQVTAFISDFRHVQKAYQAEAPEGFTVLHAAAYKKNLSVQRMRSHSKYARSVYTALEQENWDLIWAIVPPNSLVKQCARYRVTHPETKLVLDVNDLWPESFPLGGMKKLPPFQMWRSLRDRWLPEADCVVTECDLFQKRLIIPEEKYGGTIYLCRSNDIPQPDSCPIPSDETWTLCYLGSINHIIDIDAITAIIGQLKRQRPVMLHIIGAGERQELLIQQAEQAGATVMYHGPVFDFQKKQAIFDQCHFGLNVMKSTVCVGLTMKSIDYLAGGLPMLNTIPGDTWDRIEQEGFGLNWSPDQEPSWCGFSQAQGRTAARNFYERELSYQTFSQKVERMLAQL